MTVWRWTLSAAAAFACASAAAAPCAAQTGDPYATRANPDAPVPGRHYSVTHTDPRAPSPTLHSEKGGPFEPPTVALAAARVNGDTLPASPIVFIHHPGMDCTGWLYGPQIVATAGHCVSDERSRQVWKPEDFWVSDQVTKALGKDPRPVGENCSVIRVYATHGWVDDDLRKSRRYDFGALRLSPGCRLGQTRGWLGIKVESDADAGDALLVSMKPTESNSNSCADGSGSKRQTFVRCTWSVRANSADQDFFTYDADTGDGTSGGALVLKGAPNLAVGIHAHDFRQDNALARRAVRITQDVFDVLMTWHDLKE
jgi:glutamyl endopeptidase